MNRVGRLVSLSALAGLAAGCTALQSEEDRALADINDPFETENRQMYYINDAVDRTFVRPTAEAYANHAPEPVQSCVSNFFSNLLEPMRAVSNVVILDGFGALDSLNRFGFNTVAGGLGCADVATSMGIEKQDIDLGLSVRYWTENENSLYMVMPLLGPTTAIDGAGDFAGNAYLNPIDATNPNRQGRGADSPGMAKYNPYGLRDSAHRQMANGVRGVNTRASLLDATDLVDEVALDPYSFIRDAYLEQRREKAAALRERK